MTFYRNAIIIFCLLLPQTAGAWGGHVHRAVCEVVWQQLKPEERSWLLNIAQHHEIKKFSTGCAWPDWMRKESGYEHTRGWHYQNFDQPAGKDESCLKGCLLRAIRRNYNLLDSSNLSTDRQRAEALYFLAHLIADLHQPLHTGSVADKGGNLLTVQFEGKEINLHRLWDSRILAQKKEGIILEIQNVDGSHSQKLLWPDDLYRWYEESSNIAEQRIYPAYKNSRRIDAGYVAEFRPLSYQLLNRAAHRTTQILRHIIRETSE